MPVPSECPMPSVDPARLAPEEAQEASYLAASARISSFSCVVIPGVLRREDVLP